MITSTRNQHVAYCRALHRSPSRREAHAFLVEGTRLATEALDARLQPSLAFLDRAALAKTPAGQRVFDRIGGLPVAHEATPEVISAAAETRSPQGVVLVFPEPEPIPLERAAGLRLLLVLDSMADAGNAGAILRSARATGLDTVVFAGNSVDPWLGKVVRSGMGAHFGMAIIQAEWDKLTPLMEGYERLLAADANGGDVIYEVDWTLSTVLIIGSEARGLSPEARELRPASVRIPMKAGVESLNAAVAASVILFHAARAGAPATG